MLDDNKFKQDIIYEVAKVCKGLPNGKAPDMIPYEGLKYSNGSLYMVLARLYNVSHIAVLFCSVYSICI